MVATRLLTLADFEAMGEESDDYEVYDGVLVRREGMGERHGQIGFDLGYELAAWIKPRNFGQLYTSDTNFVLAQDPLVVVKPDIGFVRAERRTDEVRGDGSIPIAPDLAVEVVSPTNRERDLRNKIDRYMQAGVPLVWVLRPRRRTIAVHAPGRAPIIVGEDGELDGGDVLPGFRLPVAAIFS